MSLTSELQDENADLWERAATHPFVIEMGEGTLPTDKFRRYFLQDYVFVRDLVQTIALGAAKAPTIEDGAPLVKFLAALGPENDLFQRAFAELGASEAEYSAASATPTTQAFGDFIARTALQGRLYRHPDYPVCYGRLVSRLGGAPAGSRQAAGIAEDIRGVDRHTRTGSAGRTGRFPARAYRQCRH